MKFAIYVAGFMGVFCIFDIVVLLLNQSALSVICSSGAGGLRRSWHFPPVNDPLTGFAVPGNSLSSFGHMLVGDGCWSRYCPPTNDFSTELATSCARLLRRRDCSSEISRTPGQKPIRMLGLTIPPTAFLCVNACPGVHSMVYNDHID